MCGILSKAIYFLLISYCVCLEEGSSKNGFFRQPPKEISVRSTPSSFTRSSSYSNLNDQTADIQAGLGENCNNDDAVCLALASNDRIGLDAIKSLHRQLDDDANGNIDLSESDEFLREELKYEEGYERRQKVFHRNDDTHISVRELWEAWIRSEVHNWTVEQTVEWLSTCVELPQYAQNFMRHQVTGATLPRLAVNNMHYLNNVLGIKDPIHKQKISLKAMDVVLFGPPKDSGSHMKDLILLVLSCGAFIGFWYAYRQNKNSRRHLKRMMKDMESLHKAELALDHLQRELERAKQEQASVATQKEDLEKKLMQQGSDPSLELRSSYSDLEVSQLKAEVEILRRELEKAEGELEDRCWSPPLGLQHWLQLTYELENKVYIKKKMGAEKQLQQAREACEKLRKKRSSLVGAFVSTHGKSIDDVDRSIVEARTSLSEVTQELQERVYRWKQIELLCGCNIVNNSGLQYLESILYRGNPNGRGFNFSLKSRMSSQDDLDDDTSSIYASSSAGLESLHWREGGADSSGSETGKVDQDDDSPLASRSNVHFQLGDDGVDEPPVRNAQVQQSRNQNQDLDSISLERECSPGQQESQSDGLSRPKVSSTKRIPSQPLVGQQPPLQQQQRHSSQVSLDDETLSTDSNSTTDDEVRRRKRKLFPGFPRKNKNKMS